MRLVGIPIVKGMPLYTHYYLQSLNIIMFEMVYLFLNLTQSYIIHGTEMTIPFRAVKWDRGPQMWKEPR